MKKQNKKGIAIILVIGLIGLIAFLGFKPFALTPTGSPLGYNAILEETNQAVFYLVEYSKFYLFLLVS